MDKNMTIAKAGAFISGSSVMSNMVIFQDPVYIYLAFLGGGVSVTGILHEIVEKEHIKGIFKIISEIFKALFFGVLLTPMVFMFYINAGNKFLLPLLGVDGVSMFNSFWFIASILTSWYIIPIWGWLLDYIVSIFRRLGGGK